MRKIIIFEHITVDGLFADSNGKIDWAIRDAEVTEYSKKAGKRCRSQMRPKLHICLSM